MTSSASILSGFDPSVTIAEEAAHLTAQLTGNDVRFIDAGSNCRGGPLGFANLMESPPQKLRLGGCPQK
jgi:hypothetical protein